MPRKIRQLHNDLLKAGFVLVPKRGKGDHAYFEHPSGEIVILDGQRNDDAKPYQEKQVKQAIARIEE